MIIEKGDVVKKTLLVLFLLLLINNSYAEFGVRFETGLNLGNAIYKSYDYNIANDKIYKTGRIYFADCLFFQRVYFGNIINEIYGGWRFFATNEWKAVNVTPIRDIYTMGYKIQRKDTFLKIEYLCTYPIISAVEVFFQNKWVGSIATISIGVELSTKK